MYGGARVCVCLAYRVSIPRWYSNVMFAYIKPPYIFMMVLSFYFLWSNVWEYVRSTPISNAHTVVKYFVDLHNTIWSFNLKLYIIYIWFYGLRLALKHNLNFFIRLLHIHIILTTFVLEINKTLKTTTKKITPLFN